MIRKQKISTAIAITAFLISAGIVETRPVISIAMLAIAGAAILIGGLDRKRVSCDEVLKEHGIK